MQSSDCRYHGCTKSARQLFLRAYELVIVRFLAEKRIHTTILKLLVTILTELGISVSLTRFVPMRFKKGGLLLNTRFQEGNPTEIDGGCSEPKAMLSDAWMVLDLSNPHASHPHASPRYTAFRFFMNQLKYVHTVHQSVTV